MMDSNEKRTIHSLYSAVHQAHKQAPAMFTVQKCTTILTAIMSGQAHSWRVVGITPAALYEFEVAGFRSKPGLGVTRAHLTPRIETVRQLLLPEEPLSELDFFKIWLPADCTILCARGENTYSPPDYIRIENEDGALFSCKSVVGWRHGEQERECLRKLCASRGPASRNN